jgi:hypothetical protein
MLKLISALCLFLPSLLAQSWPIGVSTNKRYFVDATGAPWLMIGDTAHHIVSDLPQSGYATYLSNRAQYGFNAVAIFASCASGTNCPNDGSAQDGTRPFTSGTDPSNYDLATPNAAFWSKVDSLITQAATNKLIVLLNPMPVQYYMPTFRNNGTAKVTAFGNYLGARYKSYSNIIWMFGNDFQTWRTASDLALVEEFMDGVAGGGATQLQTIQLDSLRSYSNQAAVPESTSNMVYTYYEVYDYMLAAYNSSPVIPTFLGEANYEGGNNTGALSNLANRFIVRQQSWYTMTSGGAGEIWGNESVNHFDSGYPGSLNTTATSEVVYVPNLFKQYPWWTLVPDQSHKVVISGYGVYNGNNENMYNATYATTAWVPDGSLAIVYTPVASTLTVALSAFSRPVNARWYDPSNGTFASIAGSPFAITGTQNFATPGANHDGDKDWVLVLDATPTATLAPPTNLQVTSITSP